MTQTQTGNQRQSVKGEDTMARMRYTCDDGNAEAETTAASAAEAARWYVETGDWGPSSETFWVDVWVAPSAQWDDPEARQSYRVRVDPEEPACDGGEEHDWDGGEAIGSGGGVKVTDMCRRCGLRRTWDSWAHHPQTGEQGLESIRYEAADGVGWYDEDDD